MPSRKGCKEEKVDEIPWRCDPLDRLCLCEKFFEVL